MVSIPLERLEGKYEILEKIKEGGMGAIYKVRHRLLEEVRVIKVIRPQLEKDSSLRARFVREARNAIRLRHHNIAQLYDFTMDEGGNAFIVMEYIEGHTLDELLRRWGPPSVGLALETAVQALGALGYLHMKGLVHRDVSPDNLMLTREDDGSPVVKLIDLGLAKGLQDESGLTIQGTFLGKVRYASPEQFRTSEGVKLDQRSDIYSFGVVLYQLLTGVLPIRGESLTPLIAGHLFDPPVPFSESDPEGRVPESLRTVILAALAKPPADRYQQAAEFAAALAELKKDHPVDLGELRGIFVSPDDETRRIPIVRPGSTQARLDEHFGATITPPPADGESLAVTVRSGGAAVPDTPSQSVEKRLNGLLVDAGAEADRRRLKKARALAREALELQPESSKAMRLLDEIEASVRRRKPKGAPVPEADAAVERPDAPASLEEVGAPPEDVDGGRVAAVIAAVEETLDAGDHHAALEQIAAAAADLGERDELVALRRRVTDARDRKQQESIRSLLSRARTAVEEGHYDAGIELLEEALEIAPEDTIIKRVLVRTCEDRERYEADRAASESAALVVSQVRALIDDGELDEALASVDGAIVDLGERNELIALRAGVAAARVKRELRAAVGEAIVEVRGLLEAGDLEGARTAVTEARRRLGDDEELEALVGSVDAALRDAEEKRRGQAVVEAVGRIRSLLDAGDVGEAGRALAVAEKLFSGERSLTALRQQVDEIDRKRRREQVEELASEANAAVDRAALERTIAKLHQALLVDAESVELKELLDALRERQALGAVEACLEDGDLDGAERALEVAERLFGESGGVLVLRRRLEAVRRAGG